MYPISNLRRAKLGVTAAFVAHAVVFSSWAAHIPHVKEELGLSDAALGRGGRLGRGHGPQLLGTALTLATANPIVSMIGFASLGAGVALLVPTAFSAAYSASSAGSAISIVAATGWLGYLLSPPLIGHLAGSIGLTAALVTIPVVMSIAGIAIRFTGAFDAADEFHRAGS